MERPFLEEMLKTSSVSGHEEVLQKKVIHHMQGIADKVMTDATGNVIHVLNPDAPYKVMLCGHIDEIGMIVTYIDERGFVKVTKCGGIAPVRYLGTQVQIQTKNGRVNAVVTTCKELEKKSGITVDELTLDLGVDSKEEALKLVSVGDSVCAATDVMMLANERMAARALDDRIGAFIILEALKRAKEKGCQVGVYSATTVGEETTMRGAYWASQQVKPNIALIVDVTYTGDEPFASPIHYGDVKLGKGGVLCHSSLNNKLLNERLFETAQKERLPIQWEVSPGRAGTDGDVVHFTNDGVVTALVSIPLRYMHTSVETVDLKDVENTIELLACFLSHLDGNENYNPFQEEK